MSIRLLTRISVTLIIAVFCTGVVTAQSNLFERGEDGIGISYISIDHELISGIGGKAVFSGDGVSNLSILFAKTTPKKGVSGYDATILGFEFNYFAIKSIPNKQPISVALTFGIQNITIADGLAEFRQLQYGGAIYYDINLFPELLLQPMISYMLTKDNNDVKNRPVPGALTSNFTKLGVSLRIKAASKLYFHFSPTYEKAEGETIRAIDIGFIAQN